MANEKVKLVIEITKAMEDWVKNGFPDENTLDASFALEAIKQGKRLSEAELCSDCVSREIVKEQMVKYGFHSLDMTVTEFVKDELPSVYPAPKTGQNILEELKQEFRNRYPKNAWGDYELGGLASHFSLREVLEILDKYAENESKMRDATPQEKASVDRHEKCLTCIYNGQLDDECAFCTNNHLYKKSEEKDANSSDTL